MIKCNKNWENVLNLRKYEKVWENVLKVSWIWTAFPLYKIMNNCLNKRKRQWKNEFISQNNVSVVTIHWRGQRHICTPLSIHFKHFFYRLLFSLLCGQLCSRFRSPYVIINLKISFIKLRLRLRFQPTKVIFWKLNSIQLTHVENSCVN